MMENVLSFFISVRTSCITVYDSKGCNSDDRLLAPQLLVNVEAHEVLPRDHAHHPAGTQSHVKKGRTCILRDRPKIAVSKYVLICRKPYHPPSR
jgi:hypothetical protein